MKRKDVLLILTPSFIFVLAWIGFSVYHNIVTTTISEPLAMQITPISPTFDTETINNLKTRIKTSPIYQLGTSSQIVTNQSSQSASLTTSSESATSGGSILQ